MTAWPLTASITVQLKPCCGLLAGDVCDCMQWTAEVYAAFSAPILLPRHADLPVLTDPALDVWRPDLDMVLDMCPPLRWTVTAAGVEVTL